MTDQNILLQENGYPNAPDIKALRTVTYDPAVYALVPVEIDSALMIVDPREWDTAIDHYSNEQLPGVVVHVGKPYGAMYQNDETGNTVCVDMWQIANGFEDNNKRLRKVCNLYTHPTPSQPSAEALVQSAIDATIAVIEGGNFLHPESPIARESRSLVARIRALSAQQIIESCKEKS